MSLILEFNLSLFLFISSILSYSPFCKLALLPFAPYLANYDLFCAASTFLFSNWGDIKAKEFCFAPPFPLFLPRASLFY